MLGHQGIRRESLTLDDLTQQGGSSIVNKQDLKPEPEPSKPALLTPHNQLHTTVSWLTRFHRADLERGLPAQLYTYYIPYGTCTPTVHHGLPDDLGMRRDGAVTVPWVASARVVI